MGNDEKNALVSELSGLIPHYPGKDSSAIKKAREILFKFESDIESNAYLLEKVRSFVGNIEVFCSERKWKEQGADSLHRFLKADLERIRMAIQQIECSSDKQT